MRASCARRRHEVCLMRAPDPDRPSTVVSGVVQRATWRAHQTVLGLLYYSTRSTPWIGGAGAACGCHGAPEALAAAGACAAPARRVGAALRCDLLHAYLHSINNNIQQHMLISNFGHLHRTMMETVSRGTPLGPHQVESMEFLISETLHELTCHPETGARYPSDRAPSESVASERPVSTPPPDDPPKERDVEETFTGVLSGSARGVSCELSGFVPSVGEGMCIREGST